ncbi:MAG: DUF2169 family type VI secretion system accessory protein, partial [Planctomycetota bacterium]
RGRVAGFGPLNPLWPQRHRYLASLRLPADWQQQSPRRWPKDMDWRYFMDAPEEQWLPGYLQGGEQIELLHCHPQAPRWQITLPGLRPRIRVRDLDEQGQPRDRNAELRCDTIIVETDGLLTMLWRGVLPMPQPGIETVSRIAVLAENAPQTVDSNELQALLDEPDADNQPEAAGPPPEAPEQPRPERLEEPEDIWDDVTIAAMLAAGRSLAGRDMRLGRFAGVDLSGQDLSGSDLRGADLRGATLRDAVLEGCQLQQADLDGADCTGARFADADLSFVTARKAIFDQADLSRAQLLQAQLQGARLHDALAEDCHAPGLQADDVQAAGIVLRGARLPNSRWRRADLSHADFSDSICTRADFDYCTLNAVTAERADWTDARACYAEAADIKAAQAVLDGFFAKESVFERADFQATSLSGLSFFQVQATGIAISESNASPSTWKGCQMANADAHGSDLSDADFTDTRAAGINLDGIIGDRLVLNGVQMPGARMAKAICSELRCYGLQAPDLQAPGIQVGRESIFRDADLARLQAPQSTWQQCILAYCDLVEAQLQGSVVQASGLVHCRLLCVDAAKANLTGTVFDSCDCRCGKFVSATFLQAGLSDCDFSDACLVQADFSEAGREGCRFDRAQLTGTLYA